MEREEERKRGRGWLGTHGVGGVDGKREKMEREEK